MTVPTLHGGETLSKSVLFLFPVSTKVFYAITLHGASVWKHNSGQIW